MVSSSRILRCVVCTVLPSLSPCLIHGDALQMEGLHVLYRMGEQEGADRTCFLLHGTDLPG